MNVSEFPTAVRRWAEQWRAASLVGATVEWSPRLRRSLGRAYPQRMLIRLHARLRDPRFSDLLQEVLCHECAHLAVFLLHGRGASMHGPEWRRLVELAGYQPLTGLHVPELVQRQPKAVRFEHLCPRCLTRRFAKRRQPSRRCVDCRRVGLEGKLIIRPLPGRTEALHDR